MAVQVPRADSSNSDGVGPRPSPPLALRLVGDEGVVAGYDKLLEVLNALHRYCRHRPRSLLYCLAGAWRPLGPHNPRPRQTAESLHGSYRNNRQHPQGREGGGPLQVVRRKIENAAERHRAYRTADQPHGRLDSHRRAQACGRRHLDYAGRVYGRVGGYRPPVDGAQGYYEREGQPGGPTDYPRAAAAEGEYRRRRRGPSPPVGDRAAHQGTHGARHQGESSQRGPLDRGVRRTYTTTGEHPHQEHGQPDTRREELQGMGGITKDQVAGRRVPEYGKLDPALRAGLRPQGPAAKQEHRQRESCRRRRADTYRYASRHSSPDISWPVRASETLFAPYCAVTYKPIAVPRRLPSNRSAINRSPGM